MGYGPGPLRRGLLSPLSQSGVRGRADNDLSAHLRCLRGARRGDFGPRRGQRDVLDDLDGGNPAPPGEQRPFSGERAAALREQLAVPGRLVSLTPLGTRAMRQRMLAEGREAGLVGELASAAPAELLGTVAGHYPPQAAAEEIAIWRAAHGGTLDPLLQAVRDCPFVSRQAIMLNVLSVAVPEGGELLSGLLRDPGLGPVTLLVRRADLEPGDVSPAEAAWLMAGSVLELLEVGGPAAVIAQLAELPRPQREDVVRAVRDSRYPARETLQDFQALVAGPVLYAPTRLQAARKPATRPARQGRRRRCADPGRSPHGVSRPSRR